jgi:hexosaminidase
VLASPNRPRSADLPERVTLPVGRPADAVYFLHSCAWTTDGVEHFRYVLRYADGTTAEIPVVGAQHIWDWALGSRARFPRAFEGLRPSIAVTLGGGMMFPEVNLYLLEWLNPHPDKAIESIDFVSAHRGVPILLGITLGTKP